MYWYHAHDNGFMMFAVETDGHGKLHLTSHEGNILCEIDADKDKSLADNVAALVAMIPDPLPSSGWSQGRETEPDGTVVWRFWANDPGVFQKLYVEIAAHGPFFWRIGYAKEGGAAVAQGDAPTIEQARNQAINAALNIPPRRR